MRLMINIVSIVFMSLSILAPNLALSHASHGAPLSNEKALEKAIEYTGMIIENPEATNEIVLDPSWKSTTDVKIYKKSLTYFIVSLYNPSQEKTLYLHMNTYGELYGANFDGVFEGL